MLKCESKLNYLYYIEATVQELFQIVSVLVRYSSYWRASKLNNPQDSDQVELHGQFKGSMKSGIVIININFGCRKATVCRVYKQMTSMLRCNHFDQLFSKYYLVHLHVFYID